MGRNDTQKIKLEHKKIENYLKNSNYNTKIIFGHKKDHLTNS